MGLLKRLIPTGILVFFDSLFQWTGAWWQWTPSVFVRVVRQGGTASAGRFFKCPQCGSLALEEGPGGLTCPGCGSRWEVRDGIYDFREPMK